MTDSPHMTETPDATVADDTDAPAPAAPAPTDGVEHGELVEPAADDEVPEEATNSVTEPAKVMRIGSMSTLR